ELFQHVHTIKGEAQTFDLLDLVAHSRGLEELLATLRANAQPTGSATTGSIHPALLRGIKGAMEAVDLAEQMFVEASPIGRAALQQVTVNRADVARLCEIAANNSDELGALATRLASRPFGEAVATLADRVPTWADAERKRARLEVDGKDVLVPPSLAR